MAWKGQYNTAGLYDSIEQEIKDLTLDRPARLLARVIDDLRAAVMPRQVVHTCTGKTDKVPHLLGQKPDHIALGYLQVAVSGEGAGGVKILGWDDTNVELEGPPGNEVRIISYRGTKYV